MLARAAGSDGALMEGQRRGGLQVLFLGMISAPFPVSYVFYRNVKHLFKGVGFCFSLRR